MKKLIFFLLFAFSYCLNAQTLDNYGASVRITGIGSSGLNQYTIIFSNFIGSQAKDGNTFLQANLNPPALPTNERYVFFHDCSMFKITGRVGNTLTVIDLDPPNSVIPVAGQTIGITKETLVFGEWLGTVPQFGDGNNGAIQGVDNTLGACMLTHYERIKQKIFNKTTVSKGVFINNMEAAQNGVLIGEKYTTAINNTLGMMSGITVERKY